LNLCQSVLVSGAFLVTTSAAAFADIATETVIYRVPIQLQGIKFEESVHQGNPVDIERHSLDLFNRGKISGDAQLVSMADGLLESIPFDKRTISTNLLHADVNQHLHQFAKAEVALLNVLRQAPTNSNALLQISNISLIRGQFTQSEQFCLRLRKLTSSIIAATCAAAVYKMTGDAPLAISMIENFAQQIPIQPKSVQAWILAVLAEGYFATGQKRKGRETYIRSIRLFPSTYTLATYSDFLLSEKLFTEVLHVLKDAPDSKALVLRRVRALMALRAPDWQEVLKPTADRLALIKERQDSGHYRELAYYYLYIKSDPAQALKYAQANFSFQKETIDMQLMIVSSQGAGNHNATDRMTKYLHQIKSKDLHLLTLIQSKTLETAPVVP
jgi:tetratricopeptide (TPR) repeat protein